jgi:hypothetical protein
MRLIGTTTLFLALLSAACRGGVEASTNSEAVQREQLWQRFLTEIRQTGSANAPLDTNGFIRQWFELNIVHPSFGLHWDEVPAPTLIGSNAMQEVDAFIATNGWNMQTGGLDFAFDPPKTKTIQGLPWEVIKDRKLPALTHQGILYVILGYGHHSRNGIAYNPTTNAFPSRITGFKHVGNHWYAWGQPEDPIVLPQIYEGHDR